MARVTAPARIDASERAERPAVHPPESGPFDRRMKSAATPVRRELVLAALRASAQPRTIASLAEELQIHPNTVRFHLDALQRAGQVDQSLGEPTGPGRPPIVFRATGRMDPNGPTHYRLLASILASHLAGTTADPTSAAIDLGHAWGPRLLESHSPRRGRSRPRRAEALTRVTGMLSALGFAPEAATGPRASAIRLRHCPFIEVVADPIGETDRGPERRSVICSLHLGVMRGALAAMNGPITVDRLDAFVEPDLCIAHFAATREA